MWFPFITHVYHLQLQQYNLSLITSEIYAKNWRRIDRILNKSIWCKMMLLLLKENLSNWNKKMDEGSISNYRNSIHQEFYFVGKNKGMVKPWLQIYVFSEIDSDLFKLFPNQRSRNESHWKKKRNVPFINWDQGKVEGSLTRSVHGVDLRTELSGQSVRKAALG